MNDKSHRFRFRLRTLLVLVAICAALLCFWLNWKFIPGTYYRDTSGFPHGTGSTTYQYDSGQLMLREWYSGGLIYRSTWYRPDGTEIATEDYSKQSGGVGYYLRQDGTIKSKYTYAYSPDDNSYFADGEVTEYNADGTVAKMLQYKDGSDVSVVPD